LIFSAGSGFGVVAHPAVVDVTFRRAAVSVIAIGVVAVFTFMKDAVAAVLRRTTERRFAAVAYPVGFDEASRASVTRGRVFVVTLFAASHQRITADGRAQDDDLAHNTLFTLPASLEFAILRTAIATSVVSVFALLRGLPDAITTDRYLVTDAGVRATTVAVPAVVDQAGFAPVLGLVVTVVAFLGSAHQAIAADWPTVRIITLPTGFEMTLVAAVPEGLVTVVALFVLIEVAVPAVTGADSGQLLVETHPAWLYIAVLITAIEAGHILVVALLEVVEFSVAAALLA